MTEPKGKITTELLALVAKHSSTAVIILDRQDRILWANDAYEKLTGWPVHEITGKAPYEFLNAEGTDPEAIKRLANAVRDGTAAYETIRNKHRDGHAFWMRIEKEPVTDETGFVTHFISIERDVTDVMEQRNALAHSERILKDAIEALADGFVIYDADDRLVVCNERYREIYQTSADLMVEGAYFPDIIREGVRRGQYQDFTDEAEAEEWIKERLDRHNNPSNEPVEYETDDGRWIQIRECKTDNGEIVGIRTDVTQLKQAQLDAEASSKAKSDFLAHMSHELRSPLNAILGYAELTLNPEIAGSLPAEARHYVETIQKSGQHLMGLIGDILDLSKIEAGQLSLERVPFDLRHMMEELVSMMTLPARENNNRLELEMPDDLNYWITGDPVRVRQIVMNYISNAVKFTRDGLIRVCLKCIEESRKEVLLRFSVIDNGIGIPPEKQAQLFDAFIQADGSTTREYGGTGLGLAINRKLAEAMSGTVGLDSREHEGSSFHFEARFRKARQPVRKADGKGLANLPSMRLLLVEDIEINREMAKRMLEHQGHVITPAGNGLEAVQAVRENDFDAVLMDIHMPMMDGIEATNRIRMLDDPARRAVPIIALTADIAASNLEEYLKAGMNDCCSKPVDLKNLSQVLQKYAPVPGMAATTFIKADIPPPKPASAGNPNLLDRSRLLEVLRHIPDCLALFESQSEKNISAFKLDLANFEMGKLRAHAHALKGSSLNLGFKAMSGCCAEIETMLKDENQSAAVLEERIRELETLAQATLAAARKTADENHNP
ncbi:PAS-domain containing protein [Aestuariispira insulae]|uniref:histidine kinase n=1 Tax=Aestuariispira insulae TaxID=1461337 RepID=A0A3D9H9H1_9PROT|nr:PAS-domain containing protein [Aestuariispira insulae]RED46127.1 PAS domain S-box-containing protein [Aestuariispira insulae]